MSLVVTGANAIVRLSGNPMLFCGGVSVEQEEQLKEIPQLDALEVAEYAENGHRCTVTVSSFKLAPGATISGQPLANSAADYGLDFTTGSLKQRLLLPEYIIEIVLDNDDPNNAIYVATGAKFAGGSGSVDARGIWQGQWTFKCRQGRGI